MKIKNILKKINLLGLVRGTGKALYAVILGFLIVVAGIIAVSTLKIPGNIKLLVVESGSMEPSIKTGSVVVVKPESSYKVGDVITVYDSANHKVSVTHRVFEIKKESGGQIFITKGDANKTADTEVRHPEDIVGKAIFMLPLVGYLVSFAKTQAGLILLIIIPAAIIIWTELLAIKNEAIRLIKERKKRLTETEKAEVAIGKEEIKIEKGFNALLKRFAIKKIFILLFAASLFGFGTSHAFYSSSSTAGAEFTAGTWGTEDPQPAGLSAPVENGVSLNFYLGPDTHHVGFKLTGSDLVSFDTLDYLITFDSDQTQQGICGTKMIEGETEITESDLFLGYTSSLGTQVPFTGVSNIKIEVKLNGVGSQRTLNASI